MLNSPFFPSAGEPKEENTELIMAARERVLKMGVTRFSWT
jgi:hypothetical protein